MNNKLNQKDCMVAFIFDSGKFTTVFYGDKGVELILKEPGLKRNQSKIVVSLGDIFKQEMCVDISPFVIRDELCSIKWEPVISSDRDFDSEGIFNVHRGLKDFPFVVLMEDIEVDLVKKIDKRLHKDCKAYLGVTSIDVESKDQRKQFWKDLIRSFSLEDEICTVFGEDEANYMYEETIKEAGYQVHYDGLPNDLEEANRANLFSTRQSSYIQKIAQLKYIKGSNDSDRGLLKMNSALVKEVEIAGVEIWKAIEDINKVYLTKDCKYTIVDYIFTSLYQAAQGTERLLKIIVELIVYINKNDEKQKTDDLLYGHNHIALVDYIAMKGIIKFDSSCRNLLQVLADFYKDARYHRYIDGNDDRLEISIIEKFGKELRSENFDEELKKKYGKILGKISRICYKTINKLSNKLGIFAYELNSFSVACIVFWDSYQENLYKSLLEFENAKKEILWYLICNGHNIRTRYPGINIPPLSFDGPGINTFITEMIKNKLCETDIHSHISEEYNELRSRDRDKWKERVEFLNYLFSDERVCDHFLKDDGWREC